MADERLARQYPSVRFLGVVIVFHGWEWCIATRYCGDGGNLIVGHLDDSTYAAGVISDRDRRRFEKSASPSLLSGSLPSTPVRGRSYGVEGDGLHVSGDGIRIGSPANHRHRLDGPVGKFSGDLA